MFSIHFWGNDHLPTRKVNQNFLVAVDEKSKIQTVQNIINNFIYQLRTFHLLSVQNRHKPDYPSRRRLRGTFAWAFEQMQRKLLASYLYEMLNLFVVKVRDWKYFWNELIVYTF